jgi:hypothetical protein
MITLSSKQIVVIGGLLVGNLVTSAMTLGGYKSEFEQLKTQVTEDRGARTALREEVINLRVEIANLRADVKILSEKTKK